MKNHGMLIIYGPTAVGKTAFVDMLGKQMPCEIVNMDMGQFYTPFSIGTAKPDWQHASVPHHLFDILDSPRNFTVVEYRALVLKTLQDIWQRNNIPILVGGSGFYLKSLLFPPSVGEPTSDEILASIPDEKVWHQLYEIDPVRAQQIDQRDIYRVRRALAIWYATGKLPSTQEPQYDPVAQYMLVCLLRDRDDLYARINERVESMVKEGWIDEVKKLQSTIWEPFIKEKKLIGYVDILDYISTQSPTDLSNLTAIIQQRTRQYAKRQLTFWRMLKKALQQEQILHHKIPPKMDSINLTSTDIYLYSNQLSEKVVKAFLP